MNRENNKGWPARFYRDHPVKFLGLDPPLVRIIYDVLPKLNIPANATVLDIGCGDGRVLKTLKKNSPLWRLYGVDVSEPNVEALVREGFNIYLTDVNLEKLPFQDNSFDLIMMLNVIEHLVDPDNALSEAYRILKKGGLLLVTTPNLAFWINRLLIVFGLQPIYTEVSTLKVCGRKYHFLGQGNQPVGHLRIFTKPALNDILRLHGFNILKVVGFPDDRLPRPVKMIDRLLSKRASLATSMLAINTKGKSY